MDLVDAFDPAPAGAGLRLVCAPALAWTPSRSFDLITSVHGMHYLGDKLALLSRAAGWLTPTCPTPTPAPTTAPAPTTPANRP